MIKYGLISRVDSDCLERTIDLIAKEFWFVNILEVGCYAGETGNGMREYVKSKGLDCLLSGIDNSRDGEKLRFEYDNLIIGNSSEVYNQIPDESQHLIFIDGLHTFPAIVSDFFCYAPKVKKGCYLIFHDTGKHINPLSGWQGIGDRNDPDMCLGGVRKALNSIGLLQDGYDPLGTERKLASFYKGSYMAPKPNIYPGWELVFDEADTENEAGGICVFKKLY